MTKKKEKKNSPLRRINAHKTPMHMDVRVKVES